MAFGSVCPKNEILGQKRGERETIERDGWENAAKDGFEALFETIWNFVSLLGQTPLGHSVTDRLPVCLSPTRTPAGFWVFDRSTFQVSSFNGATQNDVICSKPKQAQSQSPILLWQ